MSKLNLKFVQQFVIDGKPYFYFRRKHAPRVRLPGSPFSTEFMEAYQAALASAPIDLEIGKELRSRPGTISAAIVAYYQGGAFRNLNGTTPQARRAILEKFRDEHGQKSLKAILDDQRHSEKWLRKLLDTLSSSNVKRSWLVALRHFLAWCRDQDLIRHDPSLGIKIKTKKSDGHWTWTDEEVAQYEAYHPVNSMARKALALGKYAMVRREDASLLGPQHIGRGQTIKVGEQVIEQWLSFQPKKTKHSSAVKVSTPVFPELTRIIKATPSGHLNFLVRPSGKPYSANEFGIQFAKWCDEAGLPKRCRFHGLRKFGAVHLAEHGAHPLEIAAWGGWETLTEVLRYIKAANRKKLAANALRRVLTADAEQAALVVEENKAGA